jgi:hypothetical protein
MNIKVDAQEVAKDGSRKVGSARLKVLMGPVLILQSDRCCTQWRSVFDNRISVIHLRLKTSVFIWCHLHDRKCRYVCGLASDVMENYLSALLMYKCRHS